jgi:hypothetical protein
LHMYYSQKNVIRIEVLHYLYNYGWIGWLPIK